MIFVDTNVIVDVLQDDATWADWSIGQLDDARAASELAASSVVVAELCRDYDQLRDLYTAVEMFELTLLPLDDRAAFMAGKRFVAARRDKAVGAPAQPLADFFIGAHALTSGAALLTRDTALYRRHFPDLMLITPETHP